MNAILFHPPSSMIDPDPPLGVVYLASVLENAGCQTEVIDMEPQKFGYGDIPQKIDNTKPSFIGISFMTAQYSFMKKLVQTLKQHAPDIPIIAGGVHASALPRQLLEEVPEIDFIAIGEGEKTIIEFLNYLQGKRNPWGYSVFLGECPGNSLNHWHIGYG